MADQPDSVGIACRQSMIPATSAMAGSGAHSPYASPAGLFRTTPYAFQVDSDDAMSRCQSANSFRRNSRGLGPRNGAYLHDDGSTSSLDVVTQSLDRNSGDFSAMTPQDSNVDGHNDIGGSNEGANSPAITSKMEAAKQKGQEEDTTVKKKRKTGSSRGVANLTAAQLARKRANDREAQRAIRKRTKEQIESLERKVKELASQQPFQELTRALSERDAALAENEEIRKRLSTIMAIVQPIMNASGLTEQQLSTTPPTVIQDSSSTNHISLVAHTAAPYASNASDQLMTTDSSQQRSQMPLCMPPLAKHIDLPAISNYLPQQPAPTSAAGATSTPTNATMSLNSPFTSNSSQTNSFATPSPPTPATNLCSPQWADLPQQQCWSIEELMDHKKRTLSQSLEFSDSGERLGFNFLLSDGCAGPSHQAMPLEMQQQQQAEQMRTIALRNNSMSRQMSRSVEFMQPNHVIISNLPPTCPMDGILLDFLSSRRRKAAEGASSGQLVGPPYPSVSSLLNSSVESYSHPISKVFTEILSTFPHLDALPDRVAVLYIMFLLMRWQIYPTKENYERVPEWLIPLPCQFTTPHPAWMDYLIFPRMRERMVLTNENYNFADWFIPYTADLSVNWPYEPTDALLATVGSDELMINPVFEQHLRNLDNWSLGLRFTQAFPHLADAAKIREA